MKLIGIIFSGICYHREMQSVEKQSDVDFETASSSKKPPSAVHLTEQTILLNPPQKKLPHSIRLVEIPWAKGAKGGIRLSIYDDPVQPSINVSSDVRICE